MVSPSLREIREMEAVEDAVAQWRGKASLLLPPVKHIEAFGLGDQRQCVSVLVCDCSALGPSRRQHSIQSRALLRGKAWRKASRAQWTKT